MHTELVGNISPTVALAYSFLLGLLHGVIPDEHTWPITFSYTIGGANSKAGLHSGLFYSSAFTLQRMILSQLSYFALAPFLLSPKVDDYAYAIVGLVMTAAGFIIIRKNDPIHVQFHARHKHYGNLLSSAPPIKWILIHGFIAGFGFDALSIYVNTVAVLAMPSAWLGSLPGFAFGLGTTISLVVISFLFGAFLQKAITLSAEKIRVVGALTAGRILFYGGMLFIFFGVTNLTGITHGDYGLLLISLFVIGVSIPVFVYTLWEVKTKM